MWYWFFGIPGSGKTHTAKLFSRMIGIPHFEGDDFHTEADRDAIAEGTFTLQDRYAQLERISSALHRERTLRAVITHPLPDKSSRRLVHRLSDNRAQLVHVTAPLPLIKARLRGRKNHHFGENLLDAWLRRHWEQPTCESNFVIRSDVRRRRVKAQLETLCCTSRT